MSTVKVHPSGPTMISFLGEPGLVCRSLPTAAGMRFCLLGKRVIIGTTQGGATGRLTGSYAMEREARLSWLGVDTVKLYLLYEFYWSPIKSAAEL